MSNVGLTINEIEKEIKKLIYKKEELEQQISTINSMQKTSAQASKVFQKRSLQPTNNSNNKISNMQFELDVINTQIKSYEKIKKELIMKKKSNNIKSKGLKYNNLFLNSKLNYELKDMLMEYQSDIIEKRIELDEIDKEIKKLQGSFWSLAILTISANTQKKLNELQKKRNDLAEEITQKVIKIKETILKNGTSKFQKTLRAFNEKISQPSQ